MKINVERMRYKTDSMSFLFCMLGLVCDVIQFMFIYSNVYLQTVVAKNGFKYHLIGVDIVVNILFMIFAFYIGEELKTYHRSWSIAALIMGVIQLVRINIFPKHLFEYEYITAALRGRTTFLLVLSAVMMFAAAVVSFTKSTLLINFLKGKQELK